MGCGAGGSPRYNARYLACKGSPALSGRNQNNMPGSCSCRRASWLQSGVQTRGEEEQVNVEGDMMAHRGRLLLGYTGETPQCSPVTAGMSYDPPMF